MKISKQEVSVKTQNWCRQKVGNAHELPVKEQNWCKKPNYIENMAGTKQKVRKAYTCKTS